MVNNMPAEGKRVVQPSNFATRLLPESTVPKLKGPDSRVSAENQGLLVVGVTGFEPATTCTPSKCATRLRYTPIGAEGYF